MAKYYGVRGEVIGNIGRRTGRVNHGQNVLSEKSNYFPVNHAWLRKKEFHDYLVSLINDVIVKDTFVLEKALSKYSFKETESYEPHSVVWYKGLRYRNTHRVEPGLWNPDNWTEYPLREDFEDFGTESKILFAQFVNHLYPVGSLYLTISDDFDPNEVFTDTTWQKLAAGKCLWSAENDGGKEIEAGLPNITAVWPSAFVSSNGYASSMYGSWASNTNAVYAAGLRRGQRYWPRVDAAGDTNNYNTFGFQASRSSNIYGRSSTVQPPAIKVIMWKRIS